MCFVYVNRAYENVNLQNISYLNFGVLAVVRQTHACV